MFKPDSHRSHHVPKEHAGRTLHHSEYPPGNSASVRTYSAISNALADEPIPLKVGSRAERDNRASRTSRTPGEEDIPGRRGPVPESASSNASSPPRTRDDVLSREAFESSIGRSFEALSKVNLFSKTGSETSVPFFSGSGYGREWSREEADAMVAFANKYIRRSEENKRGPVKKRRRVTVILPAASKEQRNEGD